MSREVFFLSIIYPHSSTECTCCRGFSDMAVAFLQASLQQLLNVRSNKSPSCPSGGGFSHLPLLLGTDRSNQRRPFGPSSSQQPGSLPTPLWSSQKCRQATELRLLSPFQLQEHWWEKGTTVGGSVWMCTLTSLGACPSVFPERPAKHSKGTWCLKAMGPHSSSGIHLIHLGTLSI